MAAMTDLAENQLLAVLRHNFGDIIFKLDVRLVQGILNDIYSVFLPS